MTMSEQERWEWEEAARYIRRGKPTYAADPPVQRKIMKLRERGMESWKDIETYRELEEEAPEPEPTPEPTPREALMGIIDKQKTYQTPKQREFYGMIESKQAERMMSVMPSETPQPSKFEVAESKVKETLTDPFFLKVSPESIAQFSTQLPSALGGKPLGDIMPGFVTSRQKEFFTDYFKGVKEEPLKTGALFGVSFALPGVFGGIGRVGKYFGFGNAVGKVPGATKLMSFGGKTIQYGLPTTYAGISSFRIATAERPYGEAGRIFGTEVTPMVAGGFLGLKTYTKVSDYFATMGRTEIPASQLVPKDVLTGSKTFPEAPTKTHLKLFMKESKRIPGLREPTMFHATGERFWKTSLTAAKGTSELEGLYGSYGVSPHFLRTGQKYTFYGGKLFEPFAKPGEAAIIPKGFVRGKTAPSGKAFVPGIKPEVEAILPPGTEAERISKEFFFKWEKRRIPLDVFRISKPGKPGKPSKRSYKVEDIYSSYKIPKSSPITTPSSYLGSSFFSLKSIFKSSKVSKPSKAISSGLGISKGYGKGISKVSGYGKTFPSYSSSFFRSPKSFFKGVSFSYGSSLTKQTKKQTLPLLFGIPPGMFGKRKKERYGRVFHYQPGLSALGFNLKSPRIPKGVWTGITTRLKVPSYRIKKRRRKR